VRLSLAAGVLLCATLQGGCATAQVPGDGEQDRAKPVSDIDPWERLNRDIFAFNEAFDKVLLIPVAEGYQAVLPGPVRTGIGNAFNNINDAWSAANHLLQGHPFSSAEMVTRFLVNTTLGLGGFLDWASEMGLERKREDFGQTLGRWGVPIGPYFVIPFIGPSSVRDTIGFAVDREFTLGNYLTDRKYFNALSILELIQVRSELLPATRLINQIALDKYSFMRDAYLARRRNLVYDGNPPPEPDDTPPEGAPAPK
jgi:phospholipid-binding lipoprotein MlaA